jgi:hypothetical protein
MSLVERLLGQFDTTGVPLYLPREGKISTMLSTDTTSGADILHCIEAAKDQIRKLEHVVQEMIQVLEGETAEEKKARIAAEDASPEEAARLAGWRYEHELRTQLLAEGEPFGNWLVDDTRYGGSRIVQLKEWFNQLPQNKYPERHQLAGDYYRTADSWKDALAQARKARAEEVRKQRQKALG